MDVASQFAGVLVMILLAWWTRSVWSLVIGGLVSPSVQLILLKLTLPGPTNRILWERAAAVDLLHFGKWIFLSTICGFFISQGDKIVLGKYLSLELLGIYNIGFFLGSFPLALSWLLGKNPHSALQRAASDQFAAKLSEAAEHALRFDVGHGCTSRGDGHCRCRPRKAPL